MGDPELDLENGFDHLDEREGLGDDPNNISMPSRQKSPFSAWMIEPIIFILQDHTRDATR